MKKKIVDTAIKLFNVNGIHQTSFRDIATELNVSDGHVRYYFKTKEKLLMAVFNELDAEILEVAKVEETVIVDVLDYFTGKIEGVFRVLVNYRFLFIESPKTISLYPELIKAYVSLIQRRKVLILGAFQSFSEGGLFHPDFDEQARENAFYVIFILSDGWIRTYMLTNNDEPNEQAVKFHSQLVLSILLPYLNIPKSD